MTTKVTSSVLANTGVVIGTYGSASLVPIITIDAQGRITSATAATVSGAGAGVGATTYTQTKFTATAGQTVFSVNYTVGYIQVFLNGVLLDSLTEFTASNGTSITLSQGAALNDIITVYAYSVSTIANIAGGAAGTVIYQSAANTTSNTDVGTTGHLLTSAGAGKPYWTAQTALSIANTQITGLITTPQIADSAITAPKIAPGVIPSGGFANMQVFTSPGAFTTPPTTTKIKVTVVGGGGSTGTIPSGAAYTAATGGGGGGGFATRVTPVSAATPYPVTVGGVAGTSSFGSIASATGGGSSGSATSGPIAYPAGGSGGIGSIPGATTCGYVMPGQSGVNDSWETYRGRIDGGSAGGGFGKGATVTYGDGGVGNGRPGTNYGGGASGSYKATTCGIPAPTTGGTGAPGIVIVEF
jgi:hypothetical protein